MATWNKPSPSPQNKGKYAEHLVKARAAFSKHLVVPQPELGNLWNGRRCEFDNVLYHTVEDSITSYRAAKQALKKTHKDCGVTVPSHMTLKEKYEPKRSSASTKKDEIERSEGQGSARKIERAQSRLDAAKAEQMELAAARCRRRLRAIQRQRLAGAEVDMVRDGKKKAVSNAELERCSDSITKPGSENRLGNDIQSNPVLEAASYLSPKGREPASANATLKAQTSPNGTSPQSEPLESNGARQDEATVGSRPRAASVDSTVSLDCDCGPNASCRRAVKERPQLHARGHSLTRWPTRPAICDGTNKRNGTSREPGKFMPSQTTSKQINARPANGRCTETSAARKGHTCTKLWERNRRGSNPAFDSPAGVEPTDDSPAREHQRPKTQKGELQNGKDEAEGHAPKALARAKVLDVAKEETAGCAEMRRKAKKFLVSCIQALG